METGKRCRGGVWGQGQRLEDGVRDGRGQPAAEPGRTVPGGQERTGGAALLRALLVSGPLHSQKLLKIPRAFVVSYSNIYSIRNQIRTF